MHLVSNTERWAQFCLDYMSNCMHERTSNLLQYVNQKYEHMLSSSRGRSVLYGYVYMYRKKQLQLVSPFRAGTLPLDIETGGWINTSLHARRFRPCILKMNYILVCVRFIWFLLYNSISELHSEFADLNVQERFAYILRHEYSYVARDVYEKSLRQAQILNTNMV